LIKRVRYFGESEQGACSGWPQQSRNNKQIEITGKVGFVEPVNASDTENCHRKASMALRLNNVAILVTLLLTGCGGMPNMGLPAVTERNDFKGKPLSAVTTRLGNPYSTETINGQKIHYWHVGMASRECRIRVMMAGDIVESYETFGDPPICGPYEARAN
jgi:hypothetical protein